MTPGKLFPRLIVELCRRTHSFDDSNPRAARKGVVRCHYHHYRHHHHQGCTNCGSLAAWLRENEENEKMKRKWSGIHSLHFLIFSLFPPSLSISYIKKIVSFCCKMLNMALLSQMSQNINICAMRKYFWVKFAARKLRKYRHHHHYRHHHLHRHQEPGHQGLRHHDVFTRSVCHHKSPWITSRPRHGRQEEVMGKTIITIVIIVFLLPNSPPPPHHPPSPPSTHLLLPKNKFLPDFSFLLFPPQHNKNENYNKLLLLLLLSTQKRSPPFSSTLDREASTHKILC